MEDYEFTTALEEIQSSRKEQMIILETIRKSTAAAPATTQAGGKETMSSQVRLMKQVIGDYHLSPNSKTYKELYTENQDLRKQNSELQSRYDNLSSQMLEIKKSAADKESEIMMLRLKKNATPSGIPDKKKKKKKKRKSILGMFSRPAEKELTEADKKDALTALLIRSQAYTDAQFQFLSAVLQKSNLPADAVSRLFDARLTVPRMEQVYALLCSKYGITESISAGLENKGYCHVQAEPEGQLKIPGVSGNKDSSADTGPGSGTMHALPDNTSSEGKGNPVPALIDIEPAAVPATCYPASERISIIKKSYDEILKKGGKQT